ncbi:MAG: aldo/keto reductase [Clostridia bacterium]|nr:aldo/keto reductase [Clostridia bacterium]
MNYRSDRYGNQLSILGFGCMRFMNNLGIIDMVETEKQIMSAINGGVNYFDTAYIYPGSESALGEILEKNGVRDKVYIATKLPHYLIKSASDLDKMFAEELRRLRTDHVDYYLMHMLTDIDTWSRLKELGVETWLQEKKASGAIRQVGFSYHGNSEMFCKLVDVYDWDMCLIQYNYMDEHTQAGRRGLQYANSKGLPVMIMEPLRGGKLVSRLPEAAKRIFADYKIKHTPAGWAFRWLWNQPEVTVVLSGMNSMEMVTENVATASSVEIGEIGEAEEEMLKNVVKAINADMKVGCTGCGYCMPCPKGVDIPGTFAAYNRRYAEGRFWSLVDYVICTALRKNSTAASNCIGCGKCEKHCPQGIEIRKELKNAKKVLETPLYKVVHKVVGWFARF